MKLTKNFMFVSHFYSYLIFFNMKHISLLFNFIYFLKFIKIIEYYIINFEKQIIFIGFLKK